METVGIVVNQKKKGASELLSKIHDWLGKRDVPSLDTTSRPIEEIISKSSLIVCLGGDGTLLSVASKMREKSVPILGVNLGSVGFLTEIKESEVFEELNSYFLEKSTIEERIMLSGTAKSEKNKSERRFVALNDMVVSREGLTRLLHLEVLVSGEKMTCFAGDGIIIATPTGSTAYSLSAGGAIIHPKVESFIVTPICPHSLSLRSIVVASSEKIVVKIQTDRNGEKALLTADGQENLEIDDSFIVEIMQFSGKVRLIKSSRRSYFMTLAEKFKFPS